MNIFQKDPDATLDYTFDWSDWLGVSEQISGAPTTTVTGATKGSTTYDTTSVTQWISGGTAGETATIACKITTNQGRTDERTISVSIVHL
jgi:hypothetical protein